MTERTKTIERIKDVLIIVLFISAILMLSFSWKDLSLDELSSLAQSLQEENSYRPQLSELVKPSQIKISFGSETYTALSDSWSPEAHGIAVSGAGGFVSGSDSGSSFHEMDSSSDDQTLYGYMLRMTSAYLSQPDLVKEQIEESQYREVMSYQSMAAEFSFPIPFTDFLENNGMSVPEGGEQISCMTIIGFSPVSSENLFIYDSYSDTYYRFVTKDESFAEQMSTALGELISSIEGSGITVYYTIEKLAGIENDTLIPLYVEDTASEMKCESEFSISDLYAVRRYEEMFFSSGLDFVRKITENKGSLLYNYGYNQKVLILDESGKITYTEEPNSSQYSEITFYQGLNEAVEYIGTHGGWSALKGENIRPYLSSVQQIQTESGKFHGFRYVFGIRLNGIPVTFSSGPMLQVDVYGTQITSYIRDIVVVAPEAVSTSEDVVNAIDVITGAYNEIGTILENGGTNEETASDSEKNDAALSGGGQAAGTGEGSNTEVSDRSGGSSASGQEDDVNRFENVTEKIDLIRYCLMRDTENNPYRVVPAWYIRIGEMKFWCSAEDGHLMTWDTGEEA